MALNKSYKELMELQGGGTTSQEKANAMLALIEGRKPFAYDAGADPLAQAARKETARNIQRSTQNTLGSYAGMTGGVPSSAAVSAAAQAGNQAAVLGADRITELEQLARRNYENEGAQMQNYWAMLQGQADSEYSRQQQEQQIAYQKEQDEYQKKLAMAQLAASYGDLSGLKELGIDTSKYAAGGGGYRYSAGGGEEKEGGGDPTELSAAVKNELTVLAYDNGGYIPADVWASYAAQYGEAALIAAGFKKKQSNPGSSGAGGSGGAKPGLPGLRHPGIAKGESDLHTRD